MQEAEAYEVVIPAFNVERYIGDAIRSIMAQPLTPKRIVVVDDGSTDATGAVARAASPVVEVVRQQNQGQGAATTAGVARVETPLVAFLDADDLWLPGKIEKQIARMREGALEAVFARLHMMRDGEAPDYGRSQENWNRTTMVMRTDAFRRVGAIRDMPALHGDMIEWVARARDLGIRMEMMPDVLSIRRIREGSLTYRRGGEHGYLTAVKAALDRRRAEAAGRAS